MRMIQEQIEREQKEVEARIPKAQLLPYTTDYPKVRHFWITSIKKPACLQALLYPWQSMYIDAQICAYAQVPPKPEPKTCTRPVPFQLVSVMRHEEEQQRMAAERAQAEQLEALLKEFRAQPNLSK
jgi:targeting protein for Xklp2